MMPVNALLSAGTLLQGASVLADAFSYDDAEISEAQPWTSENFRNDPNNFPFAVIGDPVGGTSPLGTYEYDE